jgi:hypothetical protein
LRPLARVELDAEIAGPQRKTVPPFAFVNVLSPVGAGD